MVEPFAGPQRVVIIGTTRAQPYTGIATSPPRPAHASMQQPNTPTYETSLYNRHIYPPALRIVPHGRAHGADGCHPVGRPHRHAPPLHPHCRHAPAARQHLCARSAAQRHGHNRAYPLPHRPHRRHAPRHSLYLPHRHPASLSIRACRHARHIWRRRQALPLPRRLCGIMHHCMD